MKKILYLLSILMLFSSCDSFLPSIFDRQPYNPVGKRILKELIIEPNKIFDLQKYYYEYYDSIFIFKDLKDTLYLNKLKKEIELSFGKSIKEASVRYGGRITVKEELNMVKEYSGANDYKRNLEKYSSLPMDFYLGSTMIYNSKSFKGIAIEFAFKDNVIKIVDIMLYYHFHGSPLDNDYLGN